MFRVLRIVHLISSHSQILRVTIIENFKVILVKLVQILYLSFAQSRIIFHQKAAGVFAFAGILLDRLDELREAGLVD